MDWNELIQNKELRSAVSVALIFLVALALFFKIKKMLWMRLKNRASHTKANFDDLLLNNLNAPVQALVVFIGLGIALKASPEEVRSHPFANYGPKLGIVMTSFWVVDRILNAWLNSSLLAKAVSDTSRVFFQTIIRMIILSIGLLVILDTLGISITPLLASLGIGSLAVALALQDTFGNFFSGLYLLLDKPVRLRDFVKLESGVEGYVGKIGWRSTHIETTANTLVVVPNSKMSASQLTNFDLPRPDTILVVAISVAMQSDLAKVESVCLDLAKQLIQTHPAAINDFVPVFRINRFWEGGIEINVVLNAKTYPDSSYLRHDYLKKIHQTFKEQGILISYPNAVLSTS